MKPRVIVVGAGFGGISLVKSLRKAPVDIVLIDKNNFHTFLPLLYQVAAAEVEVSEIAVPIRKILRGQKNVQFFNDEVVGLDNEKRIVRTLKREIEYDYLVLAFGSSTHFYKTPGAQEYSYKLREMVDAIALRNRILQQFEHAALLPEDERSSLLNFTIVGGGPTGVEYAGALIELIKGPIRKDFPEIDMSSLSITLVEGGPRPLRQFDEELGTYAKDALERKGVRVLTNSTVKRIQKDTVVLENGTVVPSAVTIWTAGIQGGTLSRQLGLRLNRRGQVVVDEHLRVTDHMYAIGDLAGVNGVPEVAPAAIQMGKYAGKQILRSVAGKLEGDAFKYRDLGSMAVVGRYGAVVQFGRIKMRGFLAWAAWIFLHIAKLLTFKNKLLVLVRWGYAYITFDKSVRLILPVHPYPGEKEKVHVEP